MIELKNVTKFYYGSESVSMALDNVSLQFESGDFVAVTGESGSGKSTLLKVITGMETYEDGEVFFDGEKTSAYGEDDWEKIRREKVAIVYQDYQVFENYTVLQNVESILLVCEDRLGVMTKSERRKKAMSYLETVGLAKQAKQKAGHLSSGQKQRLGIARALAKQTEIIVADEPTGNLDAENGSQIMELFGKLAKDHLVLVVTHNIQQAEPYITKKIRLFDGMVTEDVRVKERHENVDSEMAAEQEKELISEKIPENISEKTSVKSSVKPSKKGKRIDVLTRMELISTPVLSTFLFIFFLCSAFSIFLALGIFAENQDDINARTILNGSFENKDYTRLVIRSLDGSDIDKKDIEEIKEISHVMSVDSYDAVNDINYMYKRDEDYELEPYVSNISDYRSEKVTLTDFSHFMRSETCIDENDLKTGRLPESIYEIVVGTGDEELYGTTLTIFLSARGTWGKDSYIGGEYTVVGVCRDIKDQIYFSEELCKAIGFSGGAMEANMFFDVRRQVTNKKDSSQNSDNILNNSYAAILICNPALGDDEIRLPNERVDNQRDSETDAAIVDNTILSEGKIRVTTESASGAGAAETTEYTVVVREDGARISKNLLEVGQKLFYEIAGEPDMSQASIYLDYYPNTDQVSDALSKYRYDLVSVIRISAGDYDPDKVMTQMVSLGLSAGAAIVFLLFDIGVLVLIMRTKRKNYQIYSSLGLEKMALTKIILLQTFILAGVAFFVVPVTASIAASSGVERLRSMLNYFKFSHVMIYLIYVCLLVVLCGIFGGRSGRKVHAGRKK